MIRTYTHNDWNKTKEFTFVHIEVEYYESIYRFFVSFLGLGFGITISFKNNI